MPSNYRGITTNVFSFPTAVTVTGTASALAGAAVQITTATPHGLNSGDLVHVSQIQGTIEANGIRPASVVDPVNFTVPVPFSNAYTLGGTVQPLVYPYIPIVSDGDDPSAANFNTGGAIPNADRTTFEMTSTGAYKLSQIYYDQFYDNNAVGSSVATAWLDLTWGTTGIWLAAGVPANFSAHTYHFGAPGGWPYTGNPGPIVVEPTDRVELEFNGTCSYNYAGGATFAQLGLSFAASNQAPGHSLVLVNEPGSISVVNRQAGANDFNTVSLKTVLNITTSGVLTVNLAVNQSQAGASMSLVGGYSFTAKVWRVTAVPQ